MTFASNWKSNDTCIKVKEALSWWSSWHHQWKMLANRFDLLVVLYESQNRIKSINKQAWGGIMYIVHHIRQYVVSWHIEGVNVDHPPCLVAHHLHTSFTTQATHLKIVLTTLCWHNKISKDYHKCGPNTAVKVNIKYIWIQRKKLWNCSLQARAGERMLHWEPIICILAVSPKKVWTWWQDAVRETHHPRHWYITHHVVSPQLYSSTQRRWGTIHMRIQQLRQRLIEWNPLSQAVPLAL